MYLSFVYIGYYINMYMYQCIYVHVDVIFRYIYIHVYIYIYACTCILFTRRYIDIIAIENNDS